MDTTSGGHTGFMSRAGRLAILAAAVAAIVALPATWASAHEVREVGDLTFIVGWSDEPAYAGFGNEVQVIVEKGRKPPKPVKGGQLQAEVIFGDPASATRTSVTLDPAFDTPNEYLGYVIPTRPGTYTFHVTGTVGGQDIDETFTSGPETFNDVNNPTDAEFPVQDPTRGELAEAVDRLTARIEADGGGDPVAMWIAIGAGVLALVALVVGLRRPPA